MNIQMHPCVLLQSNSKPVVLCLYGDNYCYFGDYYSSQNHVLDIITIMVIIMMVILMV